MDLTVAKAMRLLEALSEQDTPASVTVLAKQLGLTKSNVFRLLSTLTDLGYLRRHAETGQYEMTLKVWSMGERVRSRLDVQRIAGPHINRLMHNTQETVHLSVFVDGGVTIIDKIESQHPVRAYTRIGDRPPVHCSATAKLLLAFQPQSEIDLCLSGTLKRFTKNTIVSHAKLLKELEQIRQQGYSTNQEEWREGVCGIGAPVRNASGHVFAAVGISGPAHRLPMERLKELSKEVIQCGEAVSHELGYALAEIH